MNNQVKTLIRKIILTLLFSVCVTVGFSEEIREVQLITEGDYGMALDWAMPFNSSGQVYIKFIEHDKEGNIYCVGTYKKDLTFPDGTTLTSGNGSQNTFIAKFTPDGILMWAKHLSSAGSTASVISLTEAEDIEVIYIYVETSSEKGVTYYYDEKELSTIETIGLPFLLGIDMETGALLRRIDIGKLAGFYFVNPQDNFKVTSDGTIYISGFIDEKFTGINSDFPSTVRSKGGMDKYVAKISADNKLLYDFSISGEANDIDETYDETSFGSLILTPSPSDTLYWLTIIKSDSVNVSPDETQPVYAKKIAGSEMSTVMAKYLVSGENPRLLNYKVVDVSQILTRLRCNSKGTVIGELKNKSYQYVDENQYICARITENLEIEEVSGVPYQRGSLRWVTGYGYEASYDFDENDNLIYINARPFNSTKTDSLMKIQFSENLDTSLFVTNESEISVISKYDTKNKFHWALSFSNVSPLSYDVNSKDGSLYIGAENSYFTWQFIALDWDPSQNEVNKSSTTNMAYFVKYKETYRIKTEITGNGQFSVKDTFVSHGQGTDITLIPEDGYSVDSVTTSRGEVLLPQAANTYCLDSVTDLVTVRAYLSETSFVRENLSDKLSVSPNPAENELTVENKKDFNYNILTVEGKTLTAGASTNGKVDVSELEKGFYLLQIEEDGIRYVTKFEKK